MCNTISRSPAIPSRCKANCGLGNNTRLNGCIYSALFLSNFNPRLVEAVNGEAADMVVTLDSPAWHLCVLLSKQVTDWKCLPHKGLRQSHHHVSCVYWSWGKNGREPFSWWVRKKVETWRSLTVHSCCAAGSISVHLVYFHDFFRRHRVLSFLVDTGFSNGKIEIICLCLILQGFQA